MNISNFLATELLNQVFRNTAYTRPTNVYVALYTSNPTGADTGTEVSGGSYTRFLVPFAAPTLVSGKETIKNSSEIAFNVATGDWGLVTHAAIRDAATGGNLLFYGALDNPRTILTGDRFKFLINNVALSLS